MRTSALSALVILGATLVAGSPLRVVVTTHQEISSNVHHGHDVDNVAHVVPSAFSYSDLPFAIPSDAPKTGHHRLCQLTDKAREAMDRFRAIIGLAPAPAPAYEPSPDHQTPNAGGMKPALTQEELISKLLHASPAVPAGESKENAEGKISILPFVGTPVRPAFADGQDSLVARPRPGHRVHGFRHRGSFLRRVHHALMTLGPWEGRAVAFVLGCGIGVLLRMVWVMVLVTARAIRGPSRREDGQETDADDSYGYAYDVVFDEDAEVLVPPPQYTVVAPTGEAVPVAPVAAQDEKADKAAVA
ncbi:hypothetical protein BD414DRAFT_220399 [Trametes punicea]|nr:hypothetical protein BD414DRAFT_220399 [Trametes punicea]